MKFYGCLVLVVLVLNSGAKYQQDNSDSDEEFNDALRSFRNRADFHKRLRWSKTDSRSFPINHPAVKREEDTTSLPIVEDPIRVAIFNAGSYDIHIKINYVINGKQQEDQLHTDVSGGEYRSIFIPNLANHIRIRVKEKSVINDNAHIIDEQYLNVNDLNGRCQERHEKCYLFAHTIENPVYGTCGKPYAETLAAWGGGI